MRPLLVTGLECWSKLGPVGAPAVLACSPASHSCSKRVKAAWRAALEKCGGGSGLRLRRAGSTSGGGALLLSGSAGRLPKLRPGDGQQQTPTVGRAHALTRSACLVAHASRAHRSVLAAGCCSAAWAGCTQQVARRGCVAGRREPAGSYSQRAAVSCAKLGARITRPPLPRQLPSSWRIRWGQVRMLRRTSVA